VALGYPLLRAGERGPVVGHLEEEQEGELLQVVLVREPVVAEDIAVGPELLADASGLFAHAVALLLGLWRRGVWRTPTAARSALMRSSITAGAPSVGSWSTSLPSNARMRTACPSR